MSIKIVLKIKKFFIKLFGIIKNENDCKCWLKLHKVDSSKRQVEYASGTSVMLN